jgi:hypothetical protein
MTRRERFQIRSTSYPDAQAVTPGHDGAGKRRDPTIRELRYGLWRNEAQDLNRILRCGPDLPSFHRRAKRRVRIAYHRFAGWVVSPVQNSPVRHDIGPAIEFDLEVSVPYVVFCHPAVTDRATGMLRAWLFKRLKPTTQSRIRIRVRWRSRHGGRSLDDANDRDRAKCEHGVCHLFPRWRA